MISIRSPPKPLANTYTLGETPEDIVVVMRSDTIRPSVGP